MAFDVQFTIVGIGKTAKFLAELPQIWRLKINERLQGWGSELTATAESLSPDDKLRGIDPRRRSSSEKLAKMWAWELGGGTLNVGNIDPKMPFILFPTSGGAEITPKSADHLLFFDTSGGIHRRQSVIKGSTPGQPVHDWALQAFDLNGKIAKLADSLVFK